MFFLFFFPSRFALSSIFLGGRGDWGAHGALQILGKMELRKADDIRTKHAFVWGDLNARNQPNAFSYGETWTQVTQPNAF